MSKITITIEDLGNNQVDIATEFDPPLRRAQIETPAIHAAMVMIEAVKAENGATVLSEGFEK